MKGKNQLFVETNKTDKSLTRLIKNNFFKCKINDNRNEKEVFHTP